MKLFVMLQGAKQFMHQYVNGTKGVISILLALLMTPFVSISGALINAARINSAIAIFDEALCNASNSTLGTYDEFLRKRFGLLAISQDPKAHGEKYTTQDFIAETFKFYMEQNMLSLSNTYIASTVDASGIFPLADTDVLLSQVLEYSKYSVPAKMVIDGFDLDNLLNSLTSSLSVMTSFMNTITASVGMGKSLEECQSHLNTLTEDLTKAVKAKKQYINAYNAFKESAVSHNILIDNRNRDVTACENELRSANANERNCQSYFDSIRNAYQWVVDELQELRKNPLKNKEAIEELETNYAGEIAAYYQAQSDLSSAKNRVSNATSNLQNTINSYDVKIANKRAEVSQKKADYIQKIDALATATKKVQSSVVAAQNSLKAVINSGVNLAKNVISHSATVANSNTDKQIQEMKESKDAAKERGDNTAAYLWDDEIQKAKDNKTAVSNLSTLTNATLDAKTAGVNALEDFATKKFDAHFQEVYDKLISLKAEVSAISIPRDLNKMVDVSKYFYRFEFQLTPENVSKLMQDLLNDIMASTFVATVKAVTRFIDAMLKIKLDFDPNLQGTVDPSRYAQIGGLPSIMSESSLKSQYADADLALSNHYKELLGAYSTMGSISGSVSMFETTVQNIKASITAILTCVDEEWTILNFLKKLGIILENILKIGTQIVALAINILQVIATAIYEKALLVGYIGYNIPNRCTYTKKMLTGASCALPAIGSSNNGYGFYGAETEYILIGSFSEKSNQIAISNIIYCLRMVIDAVNIASNVEVASIAAEAGAATLGIGTPIVYLLYILAEPLVDTMIIVNGSGVPVFKTKLYLTPSGISDLVGKLCTPKLNSEEKNQASKHIINIMSAGTTSEEYQQRYADAISSGIADPSKDPTKNMSTLEKTARSTLEFDYTKTLILMMMLSNSEVMLKRLADIIQIEATKKAGQSYTFNLAKSYTYLRASGNFTSNEFIKLSDSEGLKSTKRVVYRGY